MRTIQGAILLLACAVAGCSNKNFQRDDLKAEVDRAQQVARECSELLDLRNQGKTTDTFHRTHALYLLKQVEELEQDAQQAQPETEIAPAFNEYKGTLTRLSDEVKKIESQPSKESFDRLNHELRLLEGKL